MMWDNFTEEASRTTRKGPVCEVRTMLEQRVPSSARPDVEAALDNPLLQTSALHRELLKRLGDKAPSRWTVGRHRRKECTCTRETE